MLAFVIVAAGVAGFGGLFIGYAMGRYDRWLAERPAEDVLARRDAKAART